MNDAQSLFLELLDRHYGRWRAIARAYAKDDVEDLFQEIVLQIWQSLPTFRGDSQSGTWCYRVALNTALTWRRDLQTRRKRLPIAANAAEAPSRTTDSRDDSDSVLQSLLAKLSPADRGVLMMTLDELTYAEMAEVVGSSEGALRVRVHRIKRQLAEFAKEISDDF